MHYELIKLAVEAVQRQTHHVVEATADVAHSHAAYPLLDAIGTRLVERAVVVNIVVDVLIAKGGKLHIGHRTERLYIAGRSNGHASHHFMGLPRELAQHAAGISIIGRLAQHLVAEYHHRVGGDNKLVGTHLALIGMSLLARPILYLCYGYSGRYTPLQLDIAAELLTVSAMTIILFTMVQATTGILQGCGKQRIPTYTLLAGVICKVALNFTLIAMPSINIHGAPIASLVCYTVSMVPNLIFTVKYAAGGMPWREIVLRPLAAALPMGAVVWVLWHFIFTDTCLHAGRMKLLLGVMVCVGIGVIVYVLLAVAVGAVKREDLPARIRRLIPRRIGK